jgi:hypothetical protein
MGSLVVRSNFPSYNNKFGVQVVFHLFNREAFSALLNYQNPMRISPDRVIKLSMLNLRCSVQVVLFWRGTIKLCLSLPDILRRHVVKQHVAKII